MKRFIIAFAFVFATGAAGAQVPVTTEPPLVNQYIENSAEHRSSTWWNALGSQLVLGLDRPVDHVAEVSLQNVIYFATNHRGRLRLNDSAPFLVTIIEETDHTGFRMMALAALHAIGDKKYLEQAYQVARRADSARIQRMAQAALADLHRRNR